MIRHIVSMHDRIGTSRMFNEAKPIVPCEIIMHGCMSGDTKGQRCFSQLCWTYETEYPTKLAQINKEITFYEDGALTTQYDFECMQDQCYSETGFIVVCFFYFIFFLFFV